VIELPGECIMPAIPEFILRKLYLRGSLKDEGNGFSFALKNTFAPATVIGFGLDVDGEPVANRRISIQSADEIPRNATEISPANPFLLSVGVVYTIRVQDTTVGEGVLTILADTREAGQLRFTIKAKADWEKPASVRTWQAPRFLQRALKAEMEVDRDRLIGEISPHLYGQFIEHLERCIYGGLWTSDGSALRSDTLALVKALKPPLIRYPGGNFASGYHWQDGVGPKEERPQRFDQAWQSWESNQVGTDEFFELCNLVGADPFLVVNDGSGTPEEAAQWVAYCNAPSRSNRLMTHAERALSQRYVRIWGVGNEVWGPWQIGHTTADDYAGRLWRFVSAMRSIDPRIQIVAVGDRVLSDAPDDKGRLWNQAVLERAGDLIDHLSFHLYQPDREGWREAYNLEALHHTVCAAPLDVEQIIQRIARQIEDLVPGKRIGIAFDEWNLWLSPPEGAASMHQVIYTMRDALYIAGMLNVFHRQCNTLSMANLAQLVNVLPLIVTDNAKAYATPCYFPFWMYQHMERLALAVKVDCQTFESDPLGNIAALQGVPYLDVTATRDKPGKRLVLGVVNRHPYRKIKTRVNFKAFANLQPKVAWMLSADDPLMRNDFDTPEAVRIRKAEVPNLRDSGFDYEFPASAVFVFEFG
jgi:alpha-N-arabinofuranosidase